MPVPVGPPFVLPPNTTSRLVSGFHAIAADARCAGEPATPSAITCVNVPASASNFHRSFAVVAVLLASAPPKTQIALLLAAPGLSARNVVLASGA